MADPERFDSLVLRLYDAATDPALWHGLLADMADYLGAYSGQLFLWDEASNSPALIAHTAVDPETIGLYSDHYGAIDPRRRAGQAAPVGQMMVCHELFDDDYVRRSEFYNDFLIPHGGRFTVGTKLVEEASAAAIFSFHRNQRQGRFEPQHVRELERFIPHAVRAARISFKFAQMEARAGNLQAALDQVSWGVMVVDASGRIVLANADAETRLTAADALATVDGKLVAWQGRENERLSALIRRAAGGRGVGGAMTAERRTGQRPLNVLVAPLNEQTAVRFGLHRPLAIVMVSDPDRAMPTSCNVLEGIYGMTRAEAEVALSLAEGLSVEQISEARERSLNTVKTQLRLAMEKMDVSRQADVVRLVLSLARPR